MELTKEQREWLDKVLAIESMDGFEFPVKFHWLNGIWFDYRPGGELPEIPMEYRLKAFARSRNLEGSYSGPPHTAEDVERGIIEFEASMEAFDKRQEEREAKRKAQEA